MRYADILREYRYETTKDRLGSQLVARYEKDNGRPVAGHAYDAGDILTYLEAVDPTSKKAYVLDLVRWYLTGSMKRLEDAPKAKIPLSLYSKFKNRNLPPLNTLTFDQLVDLGDELGETLSKSESGKAEEQGFYNRNEARLILDNDHVKIIQPLTEKAASFFGRNTRWCTSSDEDNMFEEYHEEGPIYIILFKGQGTKKWQFHFESAQFMDERDDALTPDAVRAEPDVFNYFARPFQRIATSTPSMIGFATNPDALPLDTKLRALMVSGGNLKYFKDQTPMMREKAIVSRGVSWKDIHPENDEELSKLQVAYYKKKMDMESYFSIPNPMPAVTQLFLEKVNKAIAISDPNPRNLNAHFNAWFAFAPKTLQYILDHNLVTGWVREELLKYQNLMWPKLG